MKTYLKKINGVLQTRKANNIVVVVNDMQYVNPTEEMILEDGWVEHVTPSQEITLEKAKRRKKDDIMYYDTSRDVNMFYIKDKEVWLDKATRVGLKLRFETELAMGKVDTILWHEGVQYPFLLENAIQMLYAVEMYASACYDNTQRHLAEVNNLETIEEVESYDYRSGYPEKLRF